MAISSLPGTERRVSNSPWPIFSTAPAALTIRRVARLASIAAIVPTITAAAAVPKNSVTRNSFRGAKASSVGREIAKPQPGESMPCSFSIGM